jgi:Spy/CpxP family protein refolding chaperone
MKKSGWRLVLPLTAAALVAVLAAPPAFAADPAPAAVPAGPIGHLLKCLSIVDLTDAQKASIKTILQGEKPAMEALLAELKTDRQAMKAALEANPVDPCTVGKAAIALHTDRQALGAELKSIRTQVEATLTAEQVAKLHGCLHAPRGPAPAAAVEPEDGEGPVD